LVQGLTEIEISLQKGKNSCGVDLCLTFQCPLLNAFSLNSKIKKQMIIIGFEERGD
jgi:hypothetical protein